ncbi:MAG TPA: LytTR family DNA-binding domain-containing protein [Bryobacteraceae bacterium]|jgi:two-component system LytT family response regulator|nr:LytTR family DNA-binding domain-containing protein [Bryobacteraceae bacterium]
MSIHPMSIHQEFQIADVLLPPAHPNSVRPFDSSVLKESQPTGASMQLKTLIVDDEPVARKILREELESIDDLEIVGEAESGTEALDKIAACRPDLVLLDLQMPGMGGLDVVRKLKHGPSMPVIVIVTAYDKYALQAFDAGAIDYLLKPVGQDRLAEAVERARRVTGREAAEKVAQLQEIGEPAQGPRTRRIVGRVGEEYFLLSADEIYAFQAEGDLVWIVTAKRRYLATQTLKVLQERLKSTSFRRIHRNALVNVDHVRKMSALSSQRWLITLSNDQEFIASKRQARSVRQLLNW